MLRILHTADWHLGATLQGYSRHAEHRAALESLVAIAREERVDAVILAGDVFDANNPSAEAQHLFFETLRDLGAACPAARIVIVAGNHDSGQRLQSPQPMLENAGVTLIGGLRREGGSLACDQHLIALPDAQGVVAAHVLAVPFLHAGDRAPPPLGYEGSPDVYALTCAYGELTRAARARIGDAPLIVTGHLHVAGGLESEGAERRLLIGGEHGVGPELFPADAAYVALGHLHRPQRVGRETIRYSGSLFPLSKAEIGYRHGVEIIEIEGRATRARRVEIPRPLAFHRLPAQGAAPLEALDALFAELRLPVDPPFERRPFVHVHARLDGPSVGLKAAVDAIAERYPVRLAGMSAERPASEPHLPPDPVLRLSERSSLDLFREAFARAHGGASPSDAHLQRFAALDEEG